jgi:hypothetical protein
METLKAIRQAVKTMNKIRGNANRRRVTIKGREPIEKQYINILSRGASGQLNCHRVLRGYHWSGDIVGGIANAKRIDVYIHEVYEWNNYARGV